VISLVLRLGRAAIDAWNLRCLECGVPIGRGWLGYNDYYCDGCQETRQPETVAQIKDLARRFNDRLPTEERRNAELRADGQMFIPALDRMAEDLLKRRAAITDEERADLHALAVHLRSARAALAVADCPGRDS
jgi:hypothetical protein